jgi:hypothetical protein
MMNEWWMNECLGDILICENLSAVFLLYVLLDGLYKNNIYLFTVS